MNKLVPTIAIALLLSQFFPFAHSLKQARDLNRTFKVAQEDEQVKQHIRRIRICRVGKREYPCPN